MYPPSLYQRTKKIYRLFSRCLLGQHVISVSWWCFVKAQVNSPTCLINRYLGSFDSENCAFLLGVPWLLQNGGSRLEKLQSTNSCLTCYSCKVPAKELGRKPSFISEHRGKIFKSLEISCQHWKWGLPEVVTDQARKANNAAPRTDNIPS